MNKKWNINENDLNKINNIKSKFHLSDLVCKVLSQKNLTDDEIEVYLNPTRNDFYDPFLLPDMEKAVERIIKAIDNKEKIIIFGDYDADGITSTTILKRFFKDRNVEISEYIPNRLDEGYGLNIKAIESIAKDGYKLIITVDCGITAIEEVKIAKKLGVDVIITDHHETLDALPNAVAVVDAKRKDNMYPFNQLAGCGVAFKLTQALCQKMKLNENESLKYLDVACVGTISDIVPLVDENRVIAKLGLKLIRVTKNEGLKALFKIANYKKINSTTISFGISPRINACGRMGHQEEALKLFLTEDPIEARNLAQSIERYNKERQEIEKKIYDEAFELIKKDDDNKCIVLGKEGWHHGVIGIVSSKITDKFYKPSVLLSYEGDEAKGSGRSIPGFDLHEAVSKCSKYLTNFGGHSMAIGLTLKKENFEKFKEEFEKYASEKIKDKPMPVIDIDEIITSKDLSIDEVKELNVLEPFGEGNLEPNIMYKNLKIQAIRSLSEGKHLRLNLKDENNVTIDAIGFNLGSLADTYQIGDKVDIIGNLGINEFNNMEKVQITLKDLRLAL